MPARCTLSSCVRPFVRLSVRPSVRHKPVFYRNDWTNRAGISHGGFLPPIPHCVVRKYGYRQNSRYFLQTQKISPGVDRVVNKNSSSSSSTTVEFVDDTYTTVDESWLFTTSRSSVNLQLHSILSNNSFLQLTKFCVAVSEFLVI